MHQHPVAGHIIHVLRVDFKVVDRLGGPSGRDAGDAAEVAGGRAERFALA
jgi:hypothetical protein